ncbi:MAG: YfiR family protein [Candidatus Latescibacteria bacterium]|nr:YfiR family protein [Candidatus Latescibacterota bacterium]
MARHQFCRFDRTIGHRHPRRGPLWPDAGPGHHRQIGTRPPLADPAFHPPRPAPPCQILYLSHSSGPDLARTIALLDNRSILTVGDTEGFIQAGGMIHLLVNKQNIFFEINAAAAQRAGLRISSQLLKLTQTSAEGR